MRSRSRGSRADELEGALDVVLGVVDAVVELVSAERSEDQPSAGHRLVHEVRAQDRVARVLAVAVEQGQDGRRHLEVGRDADDEGLLPRLAGDVQRELQQAAADDRRGRGRGVGETVAPPRLATVGVWPCWAGRSVAVQAASAVTMNIVVPFESFPSEACSRARSGLGHFVERASRPPGADPSERNLPRPDPSASLFAESAAESPIRDPTWAAPPCSSPPSWASSPSASAPSAPTVSNRASRGTPGRRRSSSGGARPRTTTSSTPPSWRPWGCRAAAGRPPSGPSCSGSASSPGPSTPWRSARPRSSGWSPPSAASR